MKSVYVTFDRLDPNNGAGLVCLHEIKALRTISECRVIEQKDITGASQYEFNPFLYDYFAAQLPNHLEKGLVPNLLHLSCSPGNSILEKFHPGKYCVNVVAHDLQESINEHEMVYGKGSYHFKHNTDPYLHSILLKHATGADVIFTPSSTSKIWIDKNIPGKRVEVIPHGTEIPDSFAPYPDHFILGYLGASGPDKGLIYLLSAWRGHTSPHELVFGGSCCKSLTDQLNEFYPTVHLLGWVDKVADFYNQISVYIQPSVTEGFGIEIIEAMAYGRPVIASRGAGGADAISDGIDGFVVPPRDVDALVKKINFFIDNPALIPIMGANARRKALNYSWDKIEQKYIQVYKELLV